MIRSRLGATKYGASARWYDLISVEPVYRAGRSIGIDQLDPQPGDVVVDLGCGTGLNFPGLRTRIGPTGRLVGLDASADMLAQARRRIARSGWTNVELIHADAATVAPEDLLAVTGGAVDAALSTYALSLMPRWPTAWATLLAVTRPGGRLCVVDMQLPVGVVTPLRWLAQLACRVGGSDITAHPWAAVETDCQDVQRDSARCEHLQIRTGRRPISH